MPRTFSRCGWVWAWLVLACASVAVAEPLRFVDTAGAKAFEQGRYSDAAREFEQLRETNPDNLLVLRYLAMSYDRAGRIADALKVYTEALSRAPHHAALLYHSGETLYRARYAEDARRHFQLVLEFAPGTEYAAKAAAYLDALSRQQAARQAPGAPRRVGFYVELAAQRDEYAFTGPDGVTQDESKTDRITEYLSVEGYLLRRSDWVASLELSGYGAQYVGDAEGRKDLWQYTAGGQVQRNGRMGRVPVTASLRAVEQWVRFDGGPDYSESSIGTAALQLGLTANSSTRLQYRYTDDRFEDDGFDAAYASRDAANQAAGIRHTLYLFGRRAWVTLGAEYQHNDAEGANFVYEGPQYNAGLSVPLVLGLRLDVGYEYAEEDYTHFTGPEARETRRHEWSGSLSRWFGRSVLARVTVRDVNENSSLPALSYNRRGYGVSVAYVY